MIKINTDYIKSLPAFSDGLDNWMKHYSDFNGTLLELLDLEHLPYMDKLWLYFTSISTDLAAVILIDMVYEVLPLFESAHRYDRRPRQALELANIWSKDKTNVTAIDAYASYQVFYGATNVIGAPSHVAEAAAYTIYAIYSPTIATYFSHAIARTTDAIRLASLSKDIKSAQETQIEKLKMYLKEANY